MELCLSSRTIENNPHDQQGKHLKIHCASVCLGLGGRRAGCGSQEHGSPAARMKKSYNFDDGRMTVNVLNTNELYPLNGQVLCEL